MANYSTLEIRARVTSSRPYYRILSEYNIPTAEIDNEKNLVSFRIFGKRNEVLIPPHNRDIWALITDSGECTTNDKDGEFFKFFVKTEDDEFLLNENETIDLLRDRISDIVIPLDKENLYYEALNELSYPQGAEFDAVNGFLRSMLEDEQDSNGLLYISKITIV